ncbi:MAG: methyltransferase domain-containing protein [Chloroflexota bacterium]|nr:methyltransferase domain-containing protein [Chloroflexota bacterium]
MKTWTPADIRQRVAEVPYWHYAFDLGDGIVTVPRHGDARRQFQRLDHIMPPLLHLCGGSLHGLSVLDVGCNQGFWSMEAARAGADAVLGIEGRREHVATARFVADVRKFDNVRFETQDALDGSLARHEPFDVVLCLGLLYHVDRPLELLDQLFRLTRRYLVVDTSVIDVAAPVLQLLFEDPEDPRNAVGDGLVAVPSRSAVERMLWHVGFPQVWSLPQRTNELPPAYLQGRRATWIASRTQNDKPSIVDSSLLVAVPDNDQIRSAPELLNPLSAEPVGRFLYEKLRQFKFRNRQK